SWRVVSTLSWTPTPSATGASRSASTGSGCVAAGTRSISSWSRISDPRVQYGVHDVSHQVEDDHEEDRDHHPGQDLLVVAAEQRVDEEPAHARVFEDGLGDDQAARDGPHVDGHLG